MSEQAKGPQQSPTVAPDKSKDSAPSTSGVSTPETENKAPETPEAKAKKLFSATKIDWNSVLSSIQSDKAVRQAVASKQEYLDKILDCNDSSDKKVIDAILDALVEIVEDVATLTKFVTKRFGIQLTPHVIRSYQRNVPSTTVTFGKNGLQKSYQVLKNLPASHVKGLVSMSAVDTNKNGGKSAEGETNWDTKHIKLDYNENRTTETIGENWSGEDGTQAGLNEFDTTLTHEMGHIVDTKGLRYSGRSDFRSIAGWIQYNTPESTLNALIANMSNPFGPAKDTSSNYVLDDLDKTIAKEVALFSISSNTVYDTETFIAVHEANENALNKYENLEEEEQSLIFRTIDNSQLIKHIDATFAENYSWKENECFDYLPNIQIHQAYEHEGWWSYNNSAREASTINSYYQFRDPSEDFAELYATYYAGPQKRDQIDPQRKAWFEQTVVNDVENEQAGPQVQQSAPQGNKKK